MVLKFHQRTLPNRWQSEADLGGLEITITLTCSCLLHTRCSAKVSTDAELKPSCEAACAVKIINDPERGRVVIADCGVPQGSQWKLFTIFPVIYADSQLHQNSQAKYKRKTSSFQEEQGHNHNKQVGLFPLKHLWELQPGNKNIQALKSALHRFRVHNPQGANWG